MTDPIEPDEGMTDRDFERLLELNFSTPAEPRDSDWLTRAVRAACAFGTPEAKTAKEICDAVSALLAQRDSLRANLTETQRVFGIEGGDDPVGDDTRWTAFEEFEDRLRCDDGYTSYDPTLAEGLAHIEHQLSNALYDGGLKEHSLTVIGLQAIAAMCCALREERDSLLIVSEQQLQRRLDAERERDSLLARAEAAEGQVAMLRFRLADMYASQTTDKRTRARDCAHQALTATEPTAQAFVARIKAETWRECADLARKREDFAMAEDCEDQASALDPQPGGGK